MEKKDGGFPILFIIIVVLLAFSFIVACDTIAWLVVPIN